ncbi:MAG: hypothetical protein ACRC92_26035 [Peptostreptococcaceae bacterium]
MELHRKILSILESKFDVKKQYGSNVWYQLSCPFCGDSPNPHTKHFNIRLSPDNLFIIKCYQPKCDITGSLLRRKHLPTLGITDHEITRAIESYSERYRDKEFMHVDYGKYELPFNANSIPHQYFKLRTSRTLTWDMVNNLRVVDNICEFVTMNKDRIVIDKILKRIMSSESNGHNFIGFINNTGSQIYIRSIDDDKIKKHSRIPLQLRDELLTVHENYILDRKFSYGEEGQNIVVAEGNFDILNTYLNFAPDLTGVFIATNTASAIPKIISRFLNLMLKPNLIWVADSDITDKHIERKLKFVRDKFDKIWVLRNDLGKDLGNLSEEFRPNLYRIK